MSLNPGRSAAALALVLTLTLAYFGYHTVLQDLAYTRVQTELSFWGRGNYQPTPQAIQDSGRTLQALLESNPHHPDYLGLQASYMVWQAYWSKDLHTRDALSREAVQSQYRALLSRPAHRHSWSKMVEYASRSSSGEAMLLLAHKKMEEL